MNQAVMNAIKGAKSIEKPEKQEILNTEKEDFKGLEFSPSGAASDDSGGIDLGEMAFDANDIFDGVSEKFEALAASKQSGASAPDYGDGPTGSGVENVSAIMSPEMISITAEMYVEILEAALNVICRFVSGVQIGNYDIEKELKKKYIKISKMFFGVQNVQVTPSQLFGLMTVIVLGASGFKAWQDRKSRLSAESFAKKSATFNNTKQPGQQTELFNVEPINAIRKNYEMEDGFYVKSVTNKYVKKADREKVPAELVFFLNDFFKSNSRWPDANEVKTFLNFK